MICELEWDQSLLLNHARSYPLFSLHFAVTVHIAEVLTVSAGRFNIHTTLQIVLKCETPTSCLMVNPHLGGPAEVNTVCAWSIDFVCCSC